MFIQVKDQSSVDVPEGATARDLAETLNLRGPDQALICTLNGKQTDLSTPLKEGDTIDFLHFEDTKGKEVFWHTSAHVLAQAILRLWPDAKPTIGPPIENGFYYDFANLVISEEDFPKIEKEMEAIIKENYLSKRESFKDKEEAKKAFAHNPYKMELIESFGQGDPITGYRQGEFFDLCRGPHLHNLGKIKAIKVLKTSGAYWRGDSQNEMLTRIYAISFPDRKMLKTYIEMIEEAKKRDHKVLGPKLDLFSIKEEAPGMPFIHPKGMIIWKELQKFIGDLILERGYVEIKTPALMSKELWERSGHWVNYREHMFTSEIEKREFAIKPMNCPGGMLFYKSTMHSFRDLPLRVAEIGNVHRYEPSGSLSGLFRCRSFHQDDAHIFMKPEDIQSEITNVLELADLIYSTFGLEYRLELSTRPKSGTIGTDEEWETATSGLQNALDASKRKYRINEGDGAFYGPKIDFHIRDALGRTWQCGTVQLDMALPERFDLDYVTSEGTKKRPVMIHRALFGSIERFFGILIEHFAGKFPFWISPRQVRILTVADRHIEYAKKLEKQFKKEGFWVEVDDSSESVGKKVRAAQIDQVNYILTVGDKEIENKTVALRTRDNVVHGELDILQFIERLLEERKTRSLQSPYSA